jgi:hypothetical protein
METWAGSAPERPTLASSDRPRSRFAGHSKVSTTLDLYVGEWEKRRVNDSGTRLAAIYAARQKRRSHEAHPDLRLHNRLHT